LGSIHHRYITVVTIVTLSLAPVFRHHHWVWMLVGRHQTKTVVECARGDSCPARKRTVVEKYLAPSRLELQKAHGKRPHRP
jgi:hypothetical protein